MHILHVVRASGTDYRYGIFKSLVPMVEAMLEKGHQVEIMDMPKAAKVKMTKLELWLEKKYLNRLKKRFGKDGELAHYVVSERMIVGWRAAKYASKQAVTHVHCHDAIIGYSYRFFSKIYGATQPWGYTAHDFGRFAKLRLGLYTSDDSLNFLKNREKMAMKKAKWVVFPTMIGMHQFQKELQMDARQQNWYVVPHLVQVNLTARDLARKKIGITSDCKLLIAVGRLVPVKRFDLLLQSVSILPENERPAIIILGEGPEEASLLKQANELGVHDFEIRVTDDIGDYLSAADVYVSTSSTESFGLANCEAVLAGVPSVCTAVDAVPELLGDAAILTSDDPGEIATAIKSVITDQNLRNDLKKKADKITAGWLTSGQTADRYEKIYKSIYG